MTDSEIALKAGATIKNLTEDLPSRVFNQILETLLSQEELSGLASSTGICEETIEDLYSGKQHQMGEKNQILSYALHHYQDVTDIIYDYIFEMEETLRHLDKFQIANEVTELQKKLDPTSRLIVDYFLKNKSASIRELSELVSTKSDYEVLLLIREIINTQAQDILGYPILHFKQSYIDPVTGMKLLFRWWISDEVMALLEDVGLVDIYKENDELRVVVSPLSTIEDIEIEGDFIVMKGKDFRNRVPLFYSVDSEISRTWNNNVLDIRFKLRDD